MKSGGPIRPDPFFRVGMNWFEASGGAEKNKGPSAPQAAGNQTCHPPAVTRHGCAESPVQFTLFCYIQ
jgi:hypothetical protein